MNVMRVWLDELDRLPEYSHSIPTGQCRWKAWKAKDCKTGEFFIRQYGDTYLLNGKEYIKIHAFEIVLLQGPRKGNERLRFKVSC